MSMKGMISQSPLTFSLKPRTAQYDNNVIDKTYDLSEFLVNANV